MRFSFAGARAELWDRNPLLITVGEYFASAIGPHGSTTRWTYTVPTGKKARVTDAVCEAVRQTVAAPVGIARARIRAGNSTHFAVTHFRNVAGDTERAIMGEAGTYGAGEVIDGRTEDGSTGGTFTYQVAVGIMQGDA